jgi:hypothetical protein
VCRASRAVLSYLNFVLEAPTLLVLRQLCMGGRCPLCRYAGDNHCKYPRTGRTLPSILRLTGVIHHDSVVTLALPFVTLTPSAFAFAKISTRFLDDTACAISAAYVLLCMRRRSTSFGLWTRKARWPEGIMCRVFLFEPKPIYDRDIISQPVPA